MILTQDRVCVNVLVERKSGWGNACSKYIGHVGSKHRTVPNFEKGGTDVSNHLQRIRDYLGKILMHVRNKVKAEVDGGIK